MFEGSVQYPNRVLCKDNLNIFVFQCNSGIPVWCSTGNHRLGTATKMVLETRISSRRKCIRRWRPPTCSRTALDQVISNALSWNGSSGERSILTYDVPGYELLSS